MRSGGIAPPFLTSSVDIGVWSGSRPRRFTSVDRALETHCIGDCVGPRVGLDAMEKRKPLAPAENQTQVVQPVDQCYTDWANPVPNTLE
jgi:hypothetical protein